MSQWEYCRIDWRVAVMVISREGEAQLTQLAATIKRDEADPDSALVTHGNIHFYRSGENRRIGRIDEALTQLGIDGWELVGFTNRTEAAVGGDAATEIYILKRQVQE